jgi:phosphoribosylglycinamide formyltransferase-1
MLKVGVLASGRGSNFQAIVDASKQDNFPAQVEVLISDKEEAQVLERAERAGIANYFVDPKDYPEDKKFEQQLINILDNHGVELVIMAGFMRLLSPYFINYYRRQVMNIHPSLLPSFRGLAAQQQALEYGVKITGCTVHFADEGMDTGPIILQQPVEVKQDDTEEKLAKRIRQEEHKLYPEAIRLFAEGKLEVKEGKVLINR